MVRTLELLEMRQELDQAALRGVGRKGYLSLWNRITWCEHTGRRAETRKLDLRPGAMAMILKRDHDGSEQGFSSGGGEQQTLSTL